MGWSRAWVPDTIPIGCYMIADELTSKIISIFFRSLYNPYLISIELRGVFQRPVVRKRAFIDPY